nr:potassium transporter TrkG [Pseudemcibacter aquimaris]
MAFRDDPAKPDRYVVISFLVFTWLIIPLFASLPFMVSGVLTKLVDAYFEATSAFTTSGATMLANTALAPKTVLFWRSFLQWQGGIYIFIVAASIIPISAIGGSELFRNALPHGEGEGLLGRFKASFKPLAQIYILFTFGCMILLSLSGMSSFDALSTAMATLSSGGFTTQASSGVNQFNTMSELILIPFMLFAATNLTYHWSFFMNGRYKVYNNDREIKFFLGLFLFAVVIIFFAILGMDDAYYANVFRKFEVAMFTAASAISTTGFVPDAAKALPLSVTILCMLLMFVGGTACSSAGGFKVLRFRVLFRQADSEISRLAHPHGIVAMRMNDMNINSSILMSVWTLLFLYLSTIAFFACFYGYFGRDIDTAIGLTIANLFSAGSMTNVVAPDFIGYLGMGYAEKWMTSILMLIGRLEIIAFLIFLTPSFRKN